MKARCKKPLSKITKVTFLSTTGNEFTTEYRHGTEKELQEWIDGHLRSYNIKEYWKVAVKFIYR